MTKWLNVRAKKVTHGKENQFIKYIEKLQQITECRYNFKDLKDLDGLCNKMYNFVIQVLHQGPVVTQVLLVIFQSNHPYCTNTASLKCTPLYC